MRVPCVTCVHFSCDVVGLRDCLVSRQHKVRYAPHGQPLLTGDGEVFGLYQPPAGNSTPQRVRESLLDLSYRVLYEVTCTATAIAGQLALYSERWAACKNGRG